MGQNKIVVRGAREHNLKNITVEIPRDKLVVITGVSGSGKSSLAFDTLYAEGQRRYVESLSAYARQFLGLMEKPDVDVIEGLSPAISIDQKGVSHNPRSTVGTVTEVYDYLRLLFARVGRPHCPNCGKEISPQTPQQIVDSILSLPENTKVMLLAPVVRGRKGHHKNVLEEIRRAGYVRARIDGKIMELDEEIELDRYKLHTIEAVVDRLVIHHSEDEDYRSRLADSVETALKFGNGVIVVSIMEEGGYRDLLFSEHSACIDCGISLPEIEPRTFSFNSPHGACPHCSGLGVIMEIDPDLVIPDKSLSLKDGAIAPWRYLGKETSRYYMHLLRRVCEFYKIPMNVPVRELTKEQLDIILYGTRPGELVSLPYSDQYGRTHYYEIPYEGVIPNLQRRYRETESDYIRSEIERYMTARTCPVCNGTRLRPEALAVTVDGKNIAEVAAMSVTQALEWVERLQGPDSPLTEKERLIAHQILKELRNRLRFMVDVGLDYITLDRRASTLSGGEAQRIRLATQIGSQLAGVLYILDEPSVGLHQRDNARLIQTLKHLRDLGNTVIVVEHDENTIRSADYIIDLGPGAGDKGGEVVVAGTLDDLLRCPRSITGMYLRGERKIEVPKSRRPGNGYFLTVHGAAENNLKNITVRFPLGTFICVTGVSGSGKSSLVIEVLYKALAQKLYRAREKPGKHLFIEGIEHIDKVVNVDQSPIGRTPRSNPATYTGAFTPIRELFASLPEARLRGYTPGRFSFNVKGGRCEACEGAGIIRIEMQFLPDVYVPCDVCKGKRYNRETLEIRYKGKNISEVLDMTVEEAMEFFGNIPQIKAKLQTLYDVGLGYIKLGQPAPTLSGGEAQRVKLARELSRRATGRTLYILDEPTTGLHFADIEKLLNVLNRLVDAGNTVIVIEHNLDVIKCADWIIDLGPEGGDRGGWVIAEGTPEEVAMVPHSYTGQFLKKVLFPEEARQCAYL
jgi:excinuclease ABC subunit A